MIKPIRHTTASKFVKKSAEEQYVDLSVDPLGTYYGYFIKEEDKEKCVGIVCLKHMNFYSSEVKHLYVLPEYRGQGIAKKLVTHATNKGFEHSQIITLTTLETNERSRNVVESVGYKLLKKFEYRIPGRFVCLYHIVKESEKRESLFQKVRRALRKVLCKV